MAIDGGQNHTVVVTDRGDVYTWGAPGAHLGRDSTPSTAMVPGLVVKAHGERGIATGRDRESSVIAGVVKCALGDSCD